MLRHASIQTTGDVYMQKDRRKCRWGRELADRRRARRTACFTGEAEAEGKESQRSECNSAKSEEEELVSA
jgi:hypothetical protein